MRTLAGLGGSHRNPRARFWLGTATKRRMWVAIAVASIVTSGLAATAAADSPAPTDARTRPRATGTRCSGRTGRAAG